MGRGTFCGVGLFSVFVLFGLYQVGLAQERYTVKPGDSLCGISKRFGVTVETLRKANSLKGNAIKPKQTLAIPDQREKRTEVFKKSSTKNMTKHSGQAVKRLPDGGDSYVVQKGDNLYTVAKRAGLPADEIRRINHLSSTSLTVGQTLALFRQGPLTGVREEEENGDAEDVTAELTAEKDGERSAAVEPLGKWNNPEERSLLVRVVKTFLGAPYRLGGSTLKGLDCSAFVKKIYEVFNIHLPRTAREQSFIGKRVRKDELQEGDLVFFNTRTPRANNAHVGIYIGNNEFVHASSRTREVKIDNLEAPYFSSRFLRGVRVKELERGV